MTLVSLRRYGHRAVGRFACALQVGCGVVQNLVVRIDVALRIVVVDAEWLRLLLQLLLVLDPSFLTVGIAAQAEQ